MLLFKHQRNYLLRPAFACLLGSSLGIYLFSLGLTAHPLSCIILIASSFLCLIVGYLRETFLVELLGWVLLIASVFAYYTEGRGFEYTHLPTTFHGRVEVHYPVSANNESIPQYTSSVDYGGKVYNILLFTETPLEQEYGVLLTGEIDLKPLHPASDNSYEKYLVSEGFHAIGWTRNIVSKEEKKEKNSMEYLQLWRRKLISSFDEVIGSHMSQQTRGLLYALTLGDRSYLPRETKTSFSVSGVAHIIAVSGYHLGVVLLLLGKLLHLFFYQYRFRYIRSLLLLLGCLLYTLFTGASVPTVRAFLMVAMYLIARMAGCWQDNVQTLSLTALLFLCCNPFSYLNVGLLLSLSAVWGITTFYPLFQKSLFSKNQFLNNLNQLILVTLSAQLGVAPLLLLYFGTIPLSIIWSNIPLALLSTFSIGYGLLLILLVSFGLGWGISFLALPLEYMLQWMIDITAYFASGSTFFSITGTVDLVMILGYYSILYLIYWLALPYAVHRA